MCGSYNVQFLLNGYLTYLPTNTIYFSPNITLGSCVHFASNRAVKIFSKFFTIGHHTMNSEFSRGMFSIQNLVNKILILVNCTPCLEINTLLLCQVSSNKSSFNLLEQKISKTVDQENIEYQTTLVQSHFLPSMRLQK